jgi:UDP-N-acetylglucosamine 2-epimerase (non-hydrolysing)/UDP-GlcNAc3NAcA epimerase
MKALTVIGARPQFIKSAVMSKEFKEQNDTEILLHTGQHYDQNMSQVFFDELGIVTPAYNLGVGSDTSARQIAKMMIGIEDVLLIEKPDCVILFGDTNSTLAGAIAARKLNVPIAHIEAGLRCFLSYVPEEQNRIIADHLATYNFTPSESGCKWLANEGITKNVFNFGDIMVDSLIYYLSKAKETPMLYYVNRLKSLTGDKINMNLFSNGWYLSTIHRQENTDDNNKIENIFLALNSLDLPVILPLHPRTRHLLENGCMERFTNILFVEPISYIDSLFFASGAKKVITDSGGLHKECYVMKVPSVIIAKNSCWAETFKGNWAVLAEPDMDDILYKVKNSKLDLKAWKAYYGDGHAVSRIVKVLNDALNK